MAVRKLTGKQCQCSACGRYFKALSIFDRHRLGDHGVDRRCATDEEMATKGLGLSERGFWVAIREEPGQWKAKPTNC